MSRSVLIVDDEPLIARTLSNALKDAGYDASTAGTAEAAEKALVGAKPLSMNAYKIEISKALVRRAIMAS